jgi:hypothetical protein
MPPRMLSHRRAASSCGRVHQPIPPIPDRSPGKGAICLIRSIRHIRFSQLDQPAMQKLSLRFLRIRRGQVTGWPDVPDASDRLPSRSSAAPPPPDVADSFDPLDSAYPIFPTRRTAPHPFPARLQRCSYRPRASPSLRVMRSVTHCALHQSIGVTARPPSNIVKCR